MNNGYMCAVSKKCEGSCRKLYSERKDRKCSAFYFEREEYRIKKKNEIKKKKVDLLDL